MSLQTMLVLIVFIEGFLHYVSRREILGRDLPRPVAYVLGTLGMMVPFTFWLLERGYGEIVQVLWCVIAAGGLSVLFWYLLDWAYGLFTSVREMKAREKVASEIMHEVLDDAKK